MATVSHGSAITPSDVVLSRPPWAEAEGTSQRPEGIPYRLSAVEFFQMIDAGMIPSGRRVALWEGQLYEKMAKKLAHAGASSKVIFALLRSIPGGWSLWPENPILVNDFTAPLPDVTVVRGSPDDYTRRGAVPRSDEIGLVVEIAEASLKKNLTTTLQTYARSGIAVYWVVNLVARRVEVYSDPGVDEAGIARYQTVAMYESGTSFAFVLGGQEVAQIPVQDLIPEEFVGA